tara:strand:+ start:8332 stop:8763 length:432 start_codon:yes stop_codon:yes gene_type:complete
MEEELFNFFSAKKKGDVVMLCNIETPFILISSKSSPESLLYQITRLISISSGKRIIYNDLMNDTKMNFEFKSMIKQIEMDMDNAINQCSNSQYTRESSWSRYRHVFLIHEHKKRPHKKEILKLIDRFILQRESGIDPFRMRIT